MRNGPEALEGFEGFATHDFATHEDFATHGFAAISDDAAISVDAAIGHKVTDRFGGAEDVDLPRRRG